MGERLDIEWRAIYEDGKSLDQYNADGTENLFGDIDQARLRVFILTHHINGQVWEVDLKDGSFKIKAERFYWEGFDGADFRLVYFRRVQKKMGMFGATQEELESSIIQHIGWQTTVDGKNYQRVMAITKKGDCTIKSK